MKIVLPESKTYEPVGHCIYCGVTESAEHSLSREHVIPNGLQGRLILPKASCSTCAQETGLIEQQFMRGMIWDSRVHLGISSNPKEQPKTLRVGRFDPTEDGAWPNDLANANFRWEDREKSGHPYILALMKFAPPTIYRAGAGPSDNFELLGPQIHIDPETGKRMQSLGSGAGIFQKFSPDLFCRVLAKIGHSAAVAEFGEAQFNPFLTDMILGCKVIGRTLLVDHLRIRYHATHCTE